jgi:hypothetical protein
MKGSVAPLGREDLLMLATVLLTVLTGVPAAPQDKNADDKAATLAAKLDLLSGDETYKKSDGKESELAGKLVKANATNPPPANAYIMEVIFFRTVIEKGVFNGKEFTKTQLVPGTENHPIYVGAKGEALVPYIGKSVKLTGKLVNGTFWPARLELWDPKVKPEEDEGCCVDEKDVPLKIHARAAWPFADLSPKGDTQGRQFVIRSAAELVNNPNFGMLLDGKADGTGEKLTAQLAKLLKVDGIEWKKQMLVVVTGGVKATGGWKIDIAAVTNGEKACTVSWSLEAPKGVATQAFTHPALVALVDRCEGEVAFVMTAVQVKPATPR